MTNDAKATFTSIKNPDARTKKRNAAEKRFRAYGLLAVAVSVVALLFLLSSIWTKGSGAFYQTYLTVPVTMSAEKLDPKGNRDPDEMKKVTTIGYSKLIAQNLIDQLAVNGLDTSNVSDKNIAKLLSSESAATLRNQVLADPKLVGQTQIFTFLASGRIDGYFKGRVTMESAALDNNISPAQLVIADEMKNIGILSIKFNWKFLSAPDASELRP
ncbi:MAG TPA: phosphate ABC transporter, permease protein PstA, partial [Rhodobacter sp.]|nr:phosphate ABC transporter, permease protein PstA [Rhodobacter sp.]